MIFGKFIFKFSSSTVTYVTLCPICKIISFTKMLKLNKVHPCCLPVFDQCSVYILIMMLLPKYRSIVWTIFWSSCSLVSKAIVVFIYLWFVLVLVCRTMCHVYWTFTAAVILYQPAVKWYTVLTRSSFHIYGLFIRYASTE